MGSGQKRGILIFSQMKFSRTSAVAGILVLSLIILAFVLPFRLSFSRRVLSTVQILSRETDAYVFAITFRSNWRPTLRQWIASNLAGGLIPVPSKEDATLHIIHLRGSDDVAADSHPIAATAGSAFAYNGFLYFTWGVADQKLYPQLFVVKGRTVAAVSREDATTILSSFETFREITRAEGWDSFESYEPSGIHDFQIGESKSILHIVRTDRTYELSVTSPKGERLYSLP